jgi:hypothetical protein
MMTDKVDIVYRVSSKVVFERFEDGALALCLKDRQLSELNAIARDMIDLTDGQRSLEKVVSALADKYQTQETELLSNVTGLYKQLAEQKIVELVRTPKSGKENFKMSPAPALTNRYICNPDVVLREEDEDGGLLFNPDTNQVKVINATGLFIWRQYSDAHLLDDVVSEVKQAFDEVPMEQVVQDVQEFTDEMLASGFIGTIEK